MAFLNRFVILSLVATFQYSFITCSEKADGLYFPERTVYVRLVEETEPPVYVGQFEVVDEENGEIEYFHKEGLNIYNKFEMDSETGVITLKKKLDREWEGSQFSLTLFARDRENTSREASCELRVHLLDVNEHPPKFSRFDAPNSVSLSETAWVGGQVGKFLARDGDDGDEVLNYSLTANSSDFFNLSREYGTGYLRLAKEVDYENENQRHFDVWIVAQEEDTPEAFSAIMHVEIHVYDENDNPPVIEDGPTLFYVPWDAEMGYKVTQIIAHDADSAAVTRFGYSIVDTYEGRFWIDSKSGELFVDDHDIHEDQNKQFNIIVRVEDRDGYFSSLSCETEIQVVFSRNSSKVYQFLEDCYSTLTHIFSR